MSIGYIITKRSRIVESAYKGPSCVVAGVKPGLLYTNLEDAVRDAKELTRVNPAGFVVRTVDVKFKPRRQDATD